MRAGQRPLVVFDASTGRVLLGPTVLHALQSTPVHVVSAAVQATTAAAQELVQLAGQVGGVAIGFASQEACWLRRCTGSCKHCTL